MALAWIEQILIAIVFIEVVADVRIIDGLPGLIGKQVLFGDIGHVVACLVLGEQMVVWLILARTRVLGDRKPPFLGIRELWIHVENHPPKRVDPVLYDGTNSVFCLGSEQAANPLRSTHADW